LPTLSRPVERLFYDGAMVVLRGEDYWQSGNLDANPVRVHRGQTEAYLNDLGVDRPLYSATTGPVCQDGPRGLTATFACLPLPHPPS
jgi:hypothetical protein